MHPTPRWHRAQRLTALVIAAVVLAACQGTPVSPTTKASPKSVPSQTARKGVLLTGRLLIPDSLKVSTGVSLISNNSAGLISAGAGLISNNSSGFAGTGVEFGERVKPARHLTQAAETPLTLAGVQGARLYLADAAGNAIPALELSQTDGQGSFKFSAVPPGYTFMVVAEVPTQGKKVAMFRSIVKMSELGASLTIDPASTMITVSVVEGLKQGELGEFNPGKFQSARDAVSKKLTVENVPDFTDNAAIKAGIQRLSEQIAELRDLLGQIQSDLQEIKQSLSELRKDRSPAPVAPSPVTTAASTLAPTTTPELKPSVVPTTIPGVTGTATPRPTPSVFQSPASPGQVVVTTVAGTVGTAGFVNGNGTVARFREPRGLAVDAAGNLYVSDRGNCAVRRINTAGVVTTLAGTGAPGWVDGTSGQARFSWNWGVAVDSAGNAFIADRDNNCVRKVDPTGRVTTLAGVGSNTPGFADGTGPAARFGRPAGIAVDATGNVYVSDEANHAIRRITPAGVVTTVAGGGPDQSGTQDGQGTAARFNSPMDITFDAAGNLYIADTANHLIRKMTPEGEISTLAGLVTFGFADGTGSDAKFSSPYALDVDAAGNIYVADCFNHCIRKVSPAGEVSTLAGSVAQGFADGSGADARFFYPSGIAVSGNNTIYVSDAGNHLIRKLTIQ